MVPDIAAKGHSFTGAFAYYLHDKRTDAAGPHLATANRVAWTETRNLATDDPQAAKRIMVATATQADELKRAAGIKATGRKSNAHVYAYSIAWHPDEAAKLDRAEMVRAVDASLKALGAEHLQAVIVCHRDQKHPHVHVILNRIDPANGKMHGFSNDRLKLSDWANAYERERGNIVTPAREEKRQKRERVARDFDRAAKPQPPQQSAKPQIRQKSEAALLKDLTDAQKARHRKEWQEIAARNKAARDQIYTEFGAAIGSAAAEQKAKTKPAWAAFFKTARMSERAFYQRERSIIGILQNAIAATPLGVRGNLSALFGNVLSASSREAAFKAAQASSTREFSQAVKTNLDKEIAALKQQRQAALASQAKEYAAARAALIEKQNSETQKVRDAWRQVYERRRGKAPPSRQKAAATPEKPIMKQEFEKAGRLPDANQPAPIPHERVPLATPAPAPSPAGVPTPPQRTPHNVPQIDRAADWASSQQGRESVQNTPTPQRDFSQQAAKPQSRADYWNERAKQKAAEKPGPDRSRDRDFDRER